MIWMKNIVTVMCILYWCSYVQGRERNMDRWLITSNGVGPIAIGKKMPASAIPKEIESKYEPGFHADGVPHDLLRLDSPKLRVFFDRGPFQSEFKKDKEKDHLALLDEASKKGLGKAFERCVRRSARVQMIIVDDVGIKTEHGLGVGSRLEDIQKVLVDARARIVPPTFGKDECIVTSPTMPNVFFVFESCKAAQEDKGEVVFIVISR